MAAHYKSRYLNTFINKFRKRFNDKNLSVTDLHYLLNHFGINKNEDGTYDIDIIDALLNGYSVGPKYVNINTIIKYYQNFLNTNSQNIENTQPSTKFFYKKPKEKDDLYWRDGEDMESADAILQQKYQFESNKIITNNIITNNKMKYRNRLNEGSLKRMIKESVRQVLNEDENPKFWNDFDFSRTRGVKLPDNNDGYYHSPKEIKTKIHALQVAIKDVMDLFNGGAAGDELSKEIEKKCYDFYRFITKYVPDLGAPRRGDGATGVDKTDIPFLRKMDDEFFVPNFYKKDGSVFNDFNDK